MLERDVKRHIKQYLQSIGAYFFMPVQTGYGAATIDILCCIDGRFVGIEVKRPGVKRPSILAARPRQRQVISEIHKAGGMAFVTDSVEHARIMIEDFMRCGSTNKVI